MKNHILKYSLYGLTLIGAGSTCASSVAFAQEQSVGRYNIFPLPLSNHRVAFAQDQSAYRYTISGVVYNSQKLPVADAVITSSGHDIVRTDEQGRFEMKDLKRWATVKVTAEGYYPKEIRVTDNNSGLYVWLIDQDAVNYNETQVTIDEVREGVTTSLGIDNLGKKDFELGAVTLDKALQGKMTGLQVTQKGGMPGEGSYLSVRGIRSFVANNSPLIVINGVPFMADENESVLINGYSRSVFQSINPQDISNVTLLKGAEAAMYGSMGSNGVLLIETDGAKSDNLDTKITFAGSVGVNFAGSKLPLMNSSEYKTYLSDIAMDYYKNDMGAFFDNFAFMRDPNANNAHLYTFDTDWQDEIMNNSLTHDYLFRVEGGDAIAKYDISLGYMGDEGTLKGTKSDRFHAQINANVLVSKQFEITASVNAAYLNGEYQEQGNSLETNPMYAAYRRSPLLSPFRSSAIANIDGSYGLLRTYSSYYYGANTNTDFIVSNPMAIVNTVDASIRQYDINTKVQLLYKPISGLTIAGSFGLYVNYDKEKIFIPGINNSDIVPLFDQFGQSDNTVRVGDGEIYNMFAGLTGNYDKTFSNIHHFNVKAGVQMLMTKNEYDMGVGRNTANDFYQTLGNVSNIGRFIDGYNNAWNWLNAYVGVDYTYCNLAKIGVIASVDGSSSTGKDTDRAKFYPAVHAALMLANRPDLKDIEWLNQLDIYADYSITGNSRYSSKFGQYYYTSQPYQTIAGIIRANVPNTKLDIEVNKTLNAGVDLSVYRNRINLKGGYYRTDAENVLMLGSMSSAMGTSPYYGNDASIRNQGFEFSASIVPVVTRDFRWTLGGNLSTIDSEVLSLGGTDSFLTRLSDGSEIISRVGENPYSFYGYQTTGVYATTHDAREANLKNRNGVTYQAGDVSYVDQTQDGIINDADKVVLGSATPDFYGNLWTSIEYKGFALDLNFVYSKGNKAYNAVRRLTESSKDFSNQSRAVLRRWQNEGDITDMPRASWGDVIGNNDFSDRFVEDASYLKLRDVTLSYTFNKKILKLIHGGTIYVSGQNLLCFTDYLGADPEFSYSYSPYMQGVDYGKVTLPKSVKIGVNLKF